MDIEKETARAYRAFADGRHGEAADGAQRVLAVAPQDPGALTLAARLALISGDPVGASEILNGLVRRFPRTSALWLDFALALRELGNHREAADAAETATKIDGGGNPAAWVALGEIRYSLDQRGPAAAAFRRALGLQPGSVAACRGLCLAEDTQPGSEVATRMLKLLGSPGLRATDAAGLHYSLSQLHRRAGDREGFLRHLFTANSLQRSISPKCRAEYEAIFDRLDSAFTKELLGRVPRARPVEPVPLFVLGMPRSGTTLVEQILARHPEVTAGGELDYMRRSLRRAIEQSTGRPFPEGFEALSAETVDALASRFARRLAIIGRGSRFVTDKTPGNYHVLGLLRILFPQGPVVHLLRHPMDTCFSILQYKFDDASPHTCDVELLAYVYARYRRIMDRWREVLGDAFLSVEYERLIESPSDEARRMFAHCGLEWSESFLDPAQGSGAVRTFSAAQVRRPIYRSSVGAWRQYEAELQPLVRNLEAEFARFGLGPLPQ